MDEVVEVDFTVAVTVTLNQSVERRVTQLESCNIIKRSKVEVLHRIIIDRNQEDAVK